MKLQTQLDRIKRQIAEVTTPDIVRAMRRADAMLDAAGVAALAVGTGEIAPGFSLPDASSGQIVALRDVLASGPAVISFYRGDWCPYCSTELTALAGIDEEVRGLGGRILAITPQLATYPGSKAAQMPFQILSDANLRITNLYRLAFPLPADLRPVYTSMGKDLTVANGNQSWLLPIPATYVVAQSGRIALSFIDANFRERLEPDVILGALRVLRTMQAA